MNAVTGPRPSRPRSRWIPKHRRLRDCSGGGADVAERPARPLQARMGQRAKARSTRNHPAAHSLPRVSFAAVPITPIPSGACSRLLLGNLERPGRVGAMRRRAFGLRPRAILAVTAIRLQSLTPPRLRRCASLASGGSMQGPHAHRSQPGTITEVRSPLSLRTREGAGAARDP